MENRRILVDTSIFIDYHRKQNKSSTLLYRLSLDYDLFTSVVCYFEYLIGSKDKKFENILFSNIKILNLGRKEAIIASNIYKLLKEKNQLIDFRDIFIASNAISNEMILATLNRKHFLRIDGLKLYGVCDEQKR